MVNFVKLLDAEQEPAADTAWESAQSFAKLASSTCLLAATLPGGPDLIEAATFARLAFSGFVAAKFPQHPGSGPGNAYMELAESVGLKSVLFESDESWGTASRERLKAAAGKCAAYVAGADSSLEFDKILASFIEDALLAVRHRWKDSTSEASAALAALAKDLRCLALPAWSVDLPNPDKTFVSLVMAKNLKKILPRVNDVIKMAVNAAEAFGRSADMFEEYKFVVEKQKEILSLLTTCTICKILASDAKPDAKKQQLNQCMQLVRDENLHVPPDVQARATSDCK